MLDCTLRIWAVLLGEETIHPAEWVFEIVIVYEELSRYCNHIVAILKSMW